MLSTFRFLATMLCPARATALAMIILIILILLFYKALLITKLTEYFQSTTACQNFATKEGCEQNTPCIWCRFRGQCVQKGAYRECIEQDASQPLYQVSVPTTKPITLKI